MKPQPPPSLLLGLEPVQSCLGVARVMSEQMVPRSVEQRIVIKFLVGENVPSAEIHHRLTPTTVWGRVSPTSNPSRRGGGGCGFTLSRSHSCCAVRLVYTQISPGHIWTTLYTTDDITVPFLPCRLTSTEVMATKVQNYRMCSSSAVGAEWRKRKVHNPPLVPVLSESNQVRALPSSFFETHLNIILSSTLRYPKWSAPFIFSEENMRSCHSSLYALPMPLSLLVFYTFGYELRVTWTSIVAVRTASFMSVSRLWWLPQVECRDAESRRSIIPADRLSLSCLSPGCSFHFPVRVVPPFPQFETSKFENTDWHFIWSRMVKCKWCP